MTLPYYLTALFKVFAQALFRVEFGFVSWEFLRYLTLGQSIIQKTLWESRKSSGKSQKFPSAVLWD